MIFFYVQLDDHAESEKESALLRYFKKMTFVEETIRELNGLSRISAAHEKIDHYTHLSPSGYGIVEACE